MPQANSKRAPTPVRPAAPFAPHDAMVASQQGHIEDLVQKSRTLEHTIKKLRDALSLEQTRAKDAVNVIKQQWRAEQKDWHAGCDALQACHRIAHLKTACTLDDERIAVLKERENTRREKLARMQRDYRITMFQAREVELEGQIEDLQAELDHQVAQTAHSITSQDKQYQKTILDLQAKHATLSSELKQKSDEAVAAHKQREDAEVRSFNDELRRLREARADTEATTATNASKLSRITVQRDGLQVRVTQLERDLEEQKDNSSKLQRQLDNWQNLKKSNHADLETLRKKKAELEVELTEAQAEVERLQKVVEKERGRVTKLKDVLSEWKTECDEQQTCRKEAEDEAAAAKKAVEELEQEISELKVQLTAALRPPAAPKRKRPPPLASDVELEDARLPAPSADRNHLKARPAKRTEAADSDVELIEPSVKAQGKRKVSQEESADERPAAEKPKRPPAKKAMAAPKKEKAPKKTTPEAGAKKQKITAESSKAKKSNSAENEDSAAEDEQDPAPRKKKRKLNVGIFPSTQQQPPQFHWNQGGLGLGIPTELSPVKDAQAVPRRLHPSSSGPSFSKKIRG